MHLHFTDGVADIVKEMLGRMTLLPDGVTAIGVFSEDDELANKLYGVAKKGVKIYSAKKLIEFAEDLKVWGYEVDVKKIKSLMSALLKYTDDSYRNLDIMAISDNKGLVVFIWKVWFAVIVIVVAPRINMRFVRIKSVVM